MTFTIKGDNFLLDEHKVFLNSGEIHYFRIRKELWDKHLSAAKEAGLMAVSSYVPWTWHEPEEGVFDFDGRLSPENDLQNWLKLCQEHGLYCILKPGPFVLAEIRGAGLPDWFIKKYGDDVKMRNRGGDVVQSDGVNLFHPKYLEKVSLWYDQVMPLIKNHQINSGGPVIMMQLCNEIGVFSWLAHQADYGLGVKDRFVTYLKKKFEDIDKINQLWESAYTGFSDVEMPPDGNLPFASKADRARDYEWHCFWRRYYGDYLNMLARMARANGVKVPFYHNLPGWIFGHGYEFPVNITMYEELFGEKSELLFGIDHIPEFLSYRNMHDDRIINDITHTMQGRKPLFAAEFQSGSREYHVVTNPQEMELFYKASVINGLTGWNYYMFSQGKNPRQRGYSGDTFYWFTPLAANGERTSAYSLVERMSRLLKTNNDIIVEAKRKAEICVLFYPPYYATELERPEEGNSGLVFNYTAIRRPAYFDGLLKVLQVLNVDYDMADLNQVNASSLNDYKQVWAFTTDEMNAREQQVLADFVNNGGNLVIFPNLPDREMSQKPCTILRDSLKIKPSGYETIDSPLIDLYDLKDIKCANPQVVFDENSLTGAEVIARTIKGTACGLMKNYGKGTVTHLGTWLGYDTEAHKTAYEALLKKSGARLRNADSNNDFINVRERFTCDGKGLFFVGNYYNEVQNAKVTYTHPVTKEEITIPYQGKELQWPALYAMLTPLCLQIADGLQILHTTSDILKIRRKENETEITLFGDRDLKGEIVLEGNNVSGIKSATLDDNTLEMIRNKNRILLEYRHIHNKERILKLRGFY